MKSTFIGLVVGILLLISVPTEAQTLTVLHSFNSTDGRNPYGSLTLTGSMLYGMTNGGGGHGVGTIFNIPVSGGGLTTLFDFDWEGESPYYNNLTLTGSTFYGMTTYGGDGNKGSIFSIPLSGGTHTTLFRFDWGHGSSPFGSLTHSSDGTTLYGMTMSGGTNDVGTIFSFPVSGGTPTTLFNCDSIHGVRPQGGLTLSSDGTTLYGMAQIGGTYNYGTIFSIPVSGGTPTTLFNFDGTTHGSYPLGNITLSADGTTLYGMTNSGGANYFGTIFSIPVSGGTPTTLFNFDGTHGRNPNGGLILNGTTLYGIARGGANDLGTIFSIPTSGGIPTTLFNFDGTPHGSNPSGDLTLGSDGPTLYGMTSSGGDYSYGTIFALTIPEPSTLILLLVAFVTFIAFAWRRRRAA